MFKNRSFNVKMVKDEDVVRDEPVLLVDHSEIIERITKGAILIIVAWYGGDVARQVILTSLLGKR